MLDLYNKILIILIFIIDLLILYGILNININKIEYINNNNIIRIILYIPIKIIHNLVKLLDITKNIIEFVEILIIIILIIVIITINYTGFIISNIVTNIILYNLEMVKT